LDIINKPDHYVKVRKYEPLDVMEDSDIIKNHYLACALTHIHDIENVDIHFIIGAVLDSLKNTQNKEALLGIIAEAKDSVETHKLPIGDFIRKGQALANQSD
tara:strand:- start:415 stop:720 length:306 start_codon:yes stop_codon:yes gene_type:complete